jgi:hypothetical protein
MLTRFMEDGALEIDNNLIEKMRLGHAQLKNAIG